MTDDRAIYELLSPPEIAILLAMDPAFVLPNFVQGHSRRMRAARQIGARAHYEATHEPAGIAYERTPSVWGMRREMDHLGKVVKELEAA